LAYYIKERIGYDRVTKIRNKNAVILRISTREGIEKVINLTNGKLRVQYKMDNMKKNLTDCYKKKLIIIKEDLHLNTKSNLQNYWLVGFIDADASLQIKIMDRINLNGSTRIEVRLYLQIDQKLVYYLI
jgi:hypothetical protein